MSVKIEVSDERLTALLSGEIDHHSARFIRSEIDDAISRLKPEETALDFGGVTFMDSSGIGLVMGRYALMQEINGRLVVTNMSSHINKVMKLAGLDRLAVMESGGKSK